MEDNSAENANEKKKSKADSKPQSRIFLKSIVNWAALFTLIGSAFTFGILFNQGKFDKEKNDLYESDKALKLSKDSLTKALSFSKKLNEDLNKTNIPGIKKIFEGEWKLEVFDSIGKKYSTNNIILSYNDSTKTYSGYSDIDFRGLKISKSVVGIKIKNFFFEGFASEKNRATISNYYNDAYYQDISTLIDTRGNKDIWYLVFRYNKTKLYYKFIKAQKK